VVYSGTSGWTPQVGWVPDPLLKLPSVLVQIMPSMHSTAAEHGQPDRCHRSTPQQLPYKRRDDLLSEMRSGIINSDECGAAQTNGALGTLARVGDVCVSPFSMNWCATQSDTFQVKHDLRR
jgi:hypothetical protein